MSAHEKDLTVFFFYSSLYFVRKILPQKTGVLHHVETFLRHFKLTYLTIEFHLQNVLISQSALSRKNLLSSSLTGLFSSLW